MHTRFPFNEILLGTYCGLRDSNHIKKWMFKFKSWALETQASMERKFQMSSNLPLSSETNLLLPAPWNLNSQHFCWERPGCSHLQACLSWTISVTHSPKAFASTHRHEWFPPSPPQNPLSTPTLLKLLPLSFVPPWRNIPWKDCLGVPWWPSN